MGECRGLGRVEVDRGPVAFPSCSGASVLIYMRRMSVAKWQCAGNDNALNTHLLTVPTQASCARLRPLQTEHAAEPDGRWKPLTIALAHLS